MCLASIDDCHWYLLTWYLLKMISSPLELSKYQKTRLVGAPFSIVVHQPQKEVARPLEPGSLRLDPSYSGQVTSKVT